MVTYGFSNLSTKIGTRAGVKQVKNFDPFIVNEAETLLKFVWTVQMVKQ